MSPLGLKALGWDAITPSRRRGKNFFEIFAAREEAGSCFWLMCPWSARDGPFTPSRKRGKNFFEIFAAREGVNSCSDLRRPFGADVSHALIKKPAARVYARTAG